MIAGIIVFCSTLAALAAPFGKIDAPPLSERWFGVFVNSERVGFYRQRIEASEDGYRMEGNGTVQINVMNASKKVSMRETYLVSKSLALRSFEVEQTVNGSSSHITGMVNGNTMHIKSGASGKITEKTLKITGDVYPPPALNLYPLMRAVSAGASYTIQAFDPEEVKVKDVLITVLGEDTTSDGLSAMKLRNNLYPYVTNEIWVDSRGNTLEESVREGLVTTKAVHPSALGAFVSEWALAGKDLIYDFSMVRVQPPIKELKKLTGLAIEITGWNDALPLLQGGGQQVHMAGAGRVIFKTGTLALKLPDSRSDQPTVAQLKPADKIESDAPEIRAQAELLAAGVKNREDLVTALASWTAAWLHDSIDDGGSAVESFKSRNGNCQTHARLYTALARAAGISTRFVSGLVHVEGKGFLYHSWAECFIENRWVAVDPTYNQFPADPTHLKLLEGHLPGDMAPILAIIGRIKMNLLEAAY
ncbi:MAG: transglutaminase-like domain-containing protein [Desulfuromonadaceae bacterium]